MEMEIKIIVEDEKEYSKEIVENYIRLYKKIVKPKKQQQFSIKNLKTAIESLQLPTEKEIYLSVLEMKYGLAGGKYQTRNTNIRKALKLSQTFNVEEALRETIKALKEEQYLCMFAYDFVRVRKKLYYDEMKENPALLPIEEYNYVKLYCKLKNKKIGDIPEGDICIRKLMENIDQLKPKTQYIIINRYGLRDGAKLTLSQIGNIFGVSGESIRQTEKSALRRLRRKSYSKSQESKKISN